MNPKQNGINIAAALLWLTLAVLRIIALVDNWKLTIEITKSNYYGGGDKAVYLSAAILETVAALGLIGAVSQDESHSISKNVAMGYHERFARGQYNLDLLLHIPHAQIVALCDNYEPNLQTAAALVPGAKLYRDYHKLLEDKDIDGVVISTPLNWHAPMVLDAIAAGKNVYCEKAMARTMEQCKAIYDAYQNTDKVVYFCMQRMFDEKYRKGVQMLQDGELGDIVGMRCHWFRNADWRRDVPSPELERKINWRLYKESSGGLMTELACHQLEVCNWVAGKLPVIFGDFSYYWIIRRSLPSFKAIVERLAPYSQIGYLGTEHLDGKLVRREAVKAVRIASA